MKAIIILSVVCTAHCAAILENLPANARLETERDSSGRLTEIDIDYNKPTPTLRKAAATPSEPTVEYEHDNQGRLVEVEIDYNEQHHHSTKAMVEPLVVKYNGSPLPTSPVVNSPVLKEVIHKNPTPVETIDTVSVQVTPENSPVFKAVVPEKPTPVATVEPTLAPIIIEGPKIVLRQAPGPKAPQVIIRGPEVVYELPAAPVAPAAPVLISPTVKVEKYNAPAAPVVSTNNVDMYKLAVPVPSTPNRRFFTIGDGEVEEVFQGNVFTVNNDQSLNMVPEVDNLTPVTYNLPETSMKMFPTRRFHYEDIESAEMVDNMTPFIHNNPVLDNLTPVMYNALATSMEMFPSRRFNYEDKESAEMVDEVFDDNMRTVVNHPITYNNPDMDNLTPIMYNAPVTSLKNFPTRRFFIVNDDSSEFF